MLHNFKGKNYYRIKALAVTKTAIKQNSLVPLKTDVINFEVDLFKRFEIRKLTGLPPKDIFRSNQNNNPFSPWDKNLEIDKILNTHILILNKYPVETGHMLLITKTWAPQDGWLNLNDWKALIEVEQDSPGLWFFNSGPKAGASQPHRHLQLLYRNSKSKICPRQNWYEEYLVSKSLESNKLNNSCHVLHRRKDLEENGENLLNIYLELCSSLDIGNPSNNEKPLVPYNLLLTKDWMAIVKRKQEYYKGFSINGLGFAGYLLSTQDSDLNWLSSNGPQRLLEEVVC